MGAGGRVLSFQTSQPKTEVEIGAQLDPSPTSRQNPPPRITKSRRRRIDASRAFHLPIDGLFSDLSAGVGSVCLPDEFVRAPGLVQLSIVRDWKRGLEGARHQALVMLYRETVGNSMLPLPVKLEKFRHICARNGEECPPDMARLLQQY
jgi:hypothetical protein